MKKVFLLTIIVVFTMTLSISFANQLIINPDESILKWPTSSNKVSDTFGTPRTHGYHKGIDIAPLTRDTSGDSVYSANAGKVVYVGTPTYGRTIAINHNIIGSGVGVDYLQTVYTHLTNSVTVSVGQNVNYGTKIAEMGGSGDPNGNAFIEKGYLVHLHYETRKISSYTENYIWTGALPLDPLQFYGGAIIQSYPMETNSIEDYFDDSHKYDSQHGIIKDNTLFTLEYLLSMDYDKILDLGITDHELLELADRIKNVDKNSYKKVLSIINFE